MKKAVLLSMLILLCFSAWAEQAWINPTAGGILEAYKELPPSALMKFDITLSNSKRESIAGSLLSDRLEKSDLTDSKMANALTVTVDTNRRSPITVNIWFSPFISTAETGNKKVSVTWKKESSSSTTIDHDTATDEETGKPYDRFFSVDGVCYRYSLSIATKNKSGSSVTSVTASTTAGASINLIFTPTAQKNTRSDGAWTGSWTNVTTIPATESGVLPGITEDSEASVHATATFSMTLGTAFSELIANTRYTSTVRITIQGD